MAITQEQANQLASMYQSGDTSSLQNLINQYGVTQSDVSQYFPGFDVSGAGLTLPTSTNLTTTNPLQQFGAQNPGATDYQIAQWMKANGYTPEQVSQWSGVPLADVQARYFQTGLPSPLSPSLNTTSRIDPALLPYLQMGLQRAQQLFLTGQGPTLFPGQMYVSPSEQTLSALSQQESLARAAQPALEAAQQSYMSSLGGLAQTAGGAFLGGSPYRQQMIESAVRPLQQQFESQVLPGISSGFSKAGRYGSGAMQQAVGQASEQFGRAMGDVSSQIAYQDYARERQAQQQAQLQQAALAQAAPSFFQMGFLPSQALAQVGLSREAIAAQPLQEEIQRYQYGQQLPYTMLQQYLSSVYGSPMSSSQYPNMQTQTNPFASALGLGSLGYLGGSLIGGTPLNQPGTAALTGGLLGGALGYFGR